VIAPLLKTAVLENDIGYERQAREDIVFFYSLGVFVVLQQSNRGSTCRAMRGTFPVATYRAGEKMQDANADDLDALRAKILEDSQMLGSVMNLDLISDPDDPLVICRLKPASAEDKRAFVEKFGGIAIGESVFFKLMRRKAADN